MSFLLYIPPTETENFLYLLTPHRLACSFSVWQIYIWKYSSESFQYVLILFAGSCGLSSALHTFFLSFGLPLESAKNSNNYDYFLFFIQLLITKMWMLLRWCVCSSFSIRFQVYAATQHVKFALKRLHVNQRSKFTIAVIPRNVHSSAPSATKHLQQK